MLPRIRSYSFFWLLGAASLVALYLQTLGAATAPLNYDEGATLFFARLPLGDLLGPSGRMETNPPLFYLIEHAVARLAGSGQFALRFVSIGCATACVPAAGLLSRALASGRGGSGTAEGVIAAALVATSASHVVTAQDARAYAALALACLIAAGAACCLCRRLLSGEAIGVWPAAAYVLSCIVALYLHDTAVLMVAACNAAAVWSWFAARRGEPGPVSPRAAWRWVLLNLLVVAAWLPWLPIVVDQTAHRLAHFWLPVPGITDLRYAVLNIYGQPYFTFAQPLPDLLFVGLGALGLWRHRRDKVLPALAVCLLAGVPLASFAISQWRPIMNGKTWEWLVPLFMILVAQGCTWSRRLALPGAGLLVLVQGAACASMFAGRPDEAYPEVAGVLVRDARPGDTLYTVPASNLILLRVYGFAAKRLRVFAPSGDDPWFASKQVTTLEIGQAAQCLSGTARLWVLTRGPPAGHASLVASLAPPAIQRSDHRFGRGRMRNLELSLLASEAMTPASGAAGRPVMPTACTPGSTSLAGGTPAQTR